MLISAQKAAIRLDIASITGRLTGLAYPMLSNSEHIRQRALEEYEIQKEKLFASVERLGKVVNEKV